LKQALKVSTDKDNAYHQSIARCQIRLGQFAEAYATIQGIRERQFRLLPLAELARELAKQEALARKKALK